MFEKHRYGIPIGNLLFDFDFNFNFGLDIDFSELLKGIEFEEHTADGRHCKTTVTMEGEDTMITMQKGQKEGDKNVKFIRKFNDVGMEVQMICEDVVSDQFFTRIN